MKTMKTWVAAAVMLALTGAAQAALMNLGDGTVKDGTTNLIWLQDWNDNGLANWDAQMSWAGDLDFAGSTEWRLPSIGEYVALFNTYGNLTQVAQFTNVQSFGYWSGTGISSDSAWLFSPVIGVQDSVDKDVARYAVAVRPGDVTVAVPEPGTLGLMLAALGAGAMVRRRRSR